MAQESTSRPNIILILADDLGFSDIGCFGSEISTPNLDRLARNGLRFSSMLNVARCCPSRASLLTGLNPHQAGVGHMVIDLGVLYVPFVILILAGFSNAVNLTDGLDGLAIGATLIAAAAYAIFTYIAGHRIVSEYLQVSYQPGVGELAIFCSALVGASLGFLWFNSHPAEVFMGDVGALAIGGAIAAVAILSKQELLLFFVMGLFLMELGSVVIQVASFKLTGKRVFRMAPIHHHFELAGWKESQIVVRFWILAILFALLSLSTLKLR